MATKYLINNVRSGTSVFYAGTNYDTVADAAQIARAEEAGGVLLESTAGLVAAAAIAIKLRQAGAPLEESAMAMIAGAVQSTGTGAVPTTRQIITGASSGLTGGGDLSADLSPAVVFGDDGEVNEVGGANAAGTLAKAAPIDHEHAHGIHTDGALHGIVDETNAGFMSVDMRAKLVLTYYESGTGTLLAGSATITPIDLAANDRIFVTMKDPGAGAITGFASLNVPAASRIVGGSFQVDAIDDAKAIIATAACTFDWLLVRGSNTI